MSPARALPEHGLGWLHDLARWIGTWLWVPFYRVRLLRGGRIPAGGPVVVVANHSAFVDGPLLFGMFGRRAVFLVKAEMFAGPLAVLLPAIGQIPVRRDTVDRRPLTAALGVLRDGGLVAVFPEGTRGTGDVAAARQGAAWLARAAGAPLLPVAVRGTRRPDGGGRRFRPRVDVLVGEPLPAPSEPGRAGLAAATTTVATALRTLVRELETSREGQQSGRIDPAGDVSDR
ncbi:1-acyl-sn-glycerol-3-phosphate acyltransferase [Pseudonocardia sp. Ae168_Ps1]|uniref:lysophospholipid acyltransferase family protein n=1 Tax=unclassified Pseudonocardia TaxID=2619320 RepID=UPI00094AEF81|nr:MULTISPECIES: lysophospholipid acyltransferase family protein [unclassified Pseudonocardia]OLL71644.1 1-acyl-sn-glycerol-3-phosphate acyltransferase [Pseudonocardia sp. Ae150A_Ps1]OLL77616.1 1-acyl-sn-glycerol-3-phosphate acyltransferase [Pseudonocardia sp. Ae168_Ps1]OLL88266.1 1-acyl-sn-glycerol-3-phosphate acyltransferase [Pseudonocardia sp. Ae263_Ps1]OLL91709.1 1-acyl-sn-glycerol-3-phosphate acyltransferase [Pseudonocardia sp. Ae356_Ps1]